MKLTNLLAMLVALGAAACDSPSDPNEPGTSSGEAVAVTRITEMPRLGDDFRIAAFASSGAAYTLTGGQIRYYSSTMATARTLDQTDYLTMQLGPEESLWAVTRSQIHVYAPGSTTQRTSANHGANQIGGASLAWLADGSAFALLHSYPRPTLLRSSDVGVSWTPVTNPSPYPGTLAVGADGELILQGNPNLYVSTDHGATWEVRAPSVRGYSGQVLVTRDGSIYTWVPASGALRVSHDRGRSFTELTPFNTPPVFAELREGADGALYATIESHTQGEGLPGVHRSTNGGRTWTNLLAVRATSLAVDGERIVAGAENGLFVSTDRGATWVSQGTRYVSQLGAIAVDASGRLHAIADGVLFRRDGDAWQTVAALGAGALTIGANGELGMMWGLNLLRSSDDGRSWRQSAITDYIVYPGSALAVPGIAGRSTGEFLVSMTSYENTKGFHAGSLYRIAANGAVTRLQRGETFDRLMIDRSGRLYARSVTQNSFNHQYEYEWSWTVTGGEEWSSDASAPRGFLGMLAFNSRNQYVRTGGAGIHLGTVGGQESPERALTGLAGGSAAITGAAFDEQDRLYLVTHDAVYISSGPVR